MMGATRIMEVLIVALEVKAAFRREMAAAESAEIQGDMALAKSHLERAHILGQRWFLAHMESHFHMLRIAINESDSKEARGQIVRLIGAAPFHIVGWLPVGNTGGANISPTLPMSIPSDLQPYFAGYSLRKGMVARGVLIALIVAAYCLFAIG
ncbi:MAG: DUF3703 domain-containing protein [Sphingorhabdus sp.]|jgi:hypothetical protein|uniref:DUF3703 domain-containing protein n=1 Tax=Sphingorhabdus sp. TaxID=1902408 RepID=UPI003BAF92E2